MSGLDSTEPRLAGQAAIVTGGAGGIGQATCRALANAGAAVVVVDASRERVEATLESLPNDPCGGNFHLGLTLDVRREEEMEEMARRTIERFGRIDILVTCAGILRGKGSSPKPLAQISTEEWDQVLDTNLKGMFLSNRAVLPTMIGCRRGDIINVSSVSGKQGRAHDAPYCASKFGVIGMSESLAEEVHAYGVRVQVIMPDAIDTAIWNQNGPVPRPPDILPPERVADLILFLLTRPVDTLLLGTVIAPFRTRRRIGARKGPSEPSGEGRDEEPGLR